MSLSLTVTGSRFAVRSPYNKAFISRARTLAGQWNTVEWVFPIEVLDDVRALLRAVYGVDDLTRDTAEHVTLRVTYDGNLDSGSSGDVIVAGRQIARAFGRDSGARTAPDVVVRKGGFTSGGSRNNWRIVVRDGTVFDILRLPRPMADQMIASHPDFCEIAPPAAPVEPAAT